jgi:RNA polymerase sigma-70 factor (ECF subfamily)
MNVNADDFDDLVQDILVKLWKNLKCYEAGEATFRTWLAKVVRNMVYDYFNKEKRRFERLGQVHEISIRLHDSSPGELEAMIEKEWITHLSRLAMSRLNKVFSGGALKVFTMTLEGDSSETIATKLNLKTTSVYTLRNRVKSRYLKEVHALMQELEGS